MSIFSDLVQVIRNAKHLDVIFQRNVDDPWPYYPDGDLTNVVPLTLYNVLRRYITFMRQGVSTSTASGAELYTHGDIVEQGDERWFYINGIASSKKAAVNGAKELSAVFGRPFRLLYNPTNGLLADLVESISGRSLDKYSAPAKVFALAVVNAVRTGKKVRVVAHSQGGIIASNMVKILLATPEMTPYFEDIEFYTFAGAQDEFQGMTTIYNEHFCNERDFVARIGVLANKDDIHGAVFERLRATGHLLNNNYLGAFKEGAYCRGTSRLFRRLE